MLVNGLWKKNNVLKMTNKFDICNFDKNGCECFKLQKQKSAKVNWKSSKRGPGSICIRVQGELSSPPYYWACGVGMLGLDMQKRLQIKSRTRKNQKMSKSFSKLKNFEFPGRNPRFSGTRNTILRVPGPQKANFCRFRGGRKNLERICMIPPFQAQWAVPTVGRP